MQQLITHFTCSNSYPPIQEVILPPLWLAMPFIALLFMIATGPLLFAHLWHRHYAKVALILAAFVIAYYCVILNNSIKPIESFAEYIQFMAMLTALYVTTGGILVQVDRHATPLMNVALLFIGATVANFIGTTGASMLLIRPYIRLNTHRIKAYHIIFFIFTVSNIGGALTPIGDPPLFLGFLKGIPFAWSLVHNGLPWLIAIFLILTIFYIIDRANPIALTAVHPTGKIAISGSKNFIWLALIIAAVFLDPTIVPWLPTVHYHGHSFSFIREIIMLLTAMLAYYTANKEILKINAFNFKPLREVCFIFIGIFWTMIPALELITTLAQSEWGKQLISPTSLYWGTGLCSSMLDNAPTYLNFAAASMAAQGADISIVSSVQAYAAGGIYPYSALSLQAISVASVFFGAMTYIGNGPNFMVKAIAEQAGIAMPSFGKYIARFSLPYLLPILVVVWLLFFSSLSM